MASKESFEFPFGQKKVLLHTCCAPCSSAIIEFLMSHEMEPVIYYCNPNIYPYEEYDHQAWLETVRGLEDEPERGGRCAACFRMRLLQSARYARERGISVITTTLASSRWKSLEQIDEAGRWACSMVNAEAGDEAVRWWEKNWRKGGLQERRNQIIKEYGFYNQQWCGCEFSRRNLDK